MSEARPRVLLVTEQVDAGGKRSHVDALLAGLEAVGWEARCFDAHQLGLLERAWIAAPTRALDRIRPALGHRWILPALQGVYRRRLTSLAREWMPDLWHAQEPISFGAVRAASAGRPVALTVHGPMHREVASAYRVPIDDPTIRRIRAVESDAYRDADAVISVDRGHAAYLREFGRTERVWVIENFVDVRRFHPEVGEARLDAETEAWIAGRPVVVCPRRLVPKTGVEFAIRAARVLAERGRAVAVLVSGEGPQRAELERLTRELKVEGTLRMMGEVTRETMPGLLRRARVVLVPSVAHEGIEEATSISAIEGQACGCPVVVSDLGGLREVVEHERTGLRVPPGDPAALAGAIERLLDDAALAGRLREEALAEVRTSRSHEAGARRYAEVYHQLLENRR